MCLSVCVSVCVFYLHVCVAVCVCVCLKSPAGLQTSTVLLFGVSSVVISVHALRFTAFADVNVGF